jgi:hypothetical protein
MLLFPLLFILAVSLVVVLIVYAVRKRAYPMLAVSLSAIVCITLLAVSLYKIQMSYDHRHMTVILKSTAVAIKAGQASEVVAAYERFDTARTNGTLSFWDARNALYADLSKLATVGATSTVTNPSVER